MLKQILLGLLCVIVLAIFNHQPSSAASTRLVLAFYYPWYDQTLWNDPVVADRSPERYASSNPATMARQIEQAKGAQIDAFVSAWYGPTTQNNQTETNLHTLLAQSQAKAFKIAVLFETNGPFFHSVDTVKQALASWQTTHAQHPAYLRWNGKPVLFFWAQNRWSAAIWQTIRNQVDPQRNSLWIAEGTDLSYQGVFDGHHLYNIAWSNDVGATQRQWAQRVRAKGTLWVGTVMPGWDDTRLVERAGRYKRDRQNGAWYQQTWAGAASADPDWIVITSWNEFVENTYIEPSANYGAQYLDLTRALAGAWKAGAPAPRPAAIQPASVPAPAPRVASAAPTPKPVMIERTANPRVIECSINVIVLCLMR